MYDDITDFSSEKLKLLNHIRWLQNAFATKQAFLAAKLRFDASSGHVTCKRHEDKQSSGSSSSTRSQCYDEQTKGHAIKKSSCFTFKGRSSVKL